MIRATFSPGRAYCGCCRTEKAAHEVEAGICADCLEICYHRPDGKCVTRPGTCMSDGVTR